uniref:peptidylprolyl isomerase n=1 Tax=Polytomella parva TaxID=51329 RepID=A0A7S0YIP7_9CHLO
MSLRSISCSSSSGLASKFKSFPLYQRSHLNKLRASFHNSQSQMSEFKTSNSGIQYVDILEGSGPSPSKGETIKCHYRGTLTNGKQFDASYDRGRPLSFRIGVGEVIKGWDEGILGGPGISAMKEGGKRKLVIPPGLAYGAAGVAGFIPSNASLIFEVELMPK